MKLPFSFSLKFLFRLLFPGFTVTLALYPALRVLCDNFSSDIQSEQIIITGTIVTGWLFIIFDMHIYMALEGRRYWPYWLRKIFLSLENNRLKKLRSIYKESKNADKARYIETSVELRRFPIDENGDFTVKYPTRLGNLLTAFEEYPLRAYGMDSVFYWYRIWVAIDEDLREQVDNQQAVVDSTIYMTAALSITGLVLLIYAVLEKMHIELIYNLPDFYILLSIGLSSILCSYLLYRFSLHAHSSFGELFKSIFDMHRDKVDVEEVINFIASLTKDYSICACSRREKYMAAWRYLHNYKIKIKNRNVSVATLIKGQNPFKG